MDSRASNISGKSSRSRVNKMSKANFKGSGMNKMQNYIRRSISKSSDKSSMLIQQALKNARKERVNVEKKSKYNSASTKPFAGAKTLPPQLDQKNTISSSGTDGTINSKANDVDQIVYATSLDLIGKRDIHGEMINDSTELVHRIQLN